MSMSDSDLQRLADLLNRRRAELSAEIEAHRSAREAESDAGSEVADQKDEAAHRQFSAIVEAEDERDVAELRSIEAALRRMAEGSYGRCVSCGEPIGVQRLLAQPAALRCASCQSEHEKHALHR
jgi:RNA polymerase-binding protein DksA